MSATLKRNGKAQSVRGAALIAAAGGFEANIEWLKKYWGAAADNFLIRGTPYNRGEVLRMLLDAGVAAGRRPDAVPRRRDRRARAEIRRRHRHPARLRSFSASSSTATAKRFYDEGEDIWPKRYAIWGRLVAQQPEQIGYSIIDAKSLRLFMPSVFPAGRGRHASRELAVKLGLDPAALEKTVGDFNAAVRPGTFDHTVLDDCRTEGLTTAEIALGAQHRHAAVLRLPAAPRHHLHLSRRAR